MLTKEFSSENLNLLLRKRDEVHYPFIRVNFQKKGYLHNISERILSGTYFFHKLTTKSIRNFKAYRTDKLGDELVLRRLSEIIKKTYKIKTGDRYRITEQVQSLIAEALPKNILRLDISSFYESVDRDLIINKIRSDRRISYSTITLLTRFFHSLSSIGALGLPRGMGISAVLSELYLHNFDADVRKINGVYFYARYVDDIIVFSTNSSSQVKDELSHLLSKVGLSLNQKKSTEQFIGCRCAIKCSHLGACPCSQKCKCKIVKTKKVNLEFIGYNFSFPDVIGTNKAKRVSVGIDVATKKLDRLKLRLIYSFLSHIKNPNFDLLKKRLQFLTENQKLNSFQIKGKLKTGIYYNYPLINDMKSLKELDSFLKRILFTSSANFTSKVSSALSYAERDELAKLSFVSGFKSRRTRRFSSGKIAEIRKCWKYG